jgi:hypothetical protein
MCSSQFAQIFKTFSVVEAIAYQQVVTHRPGNFSAKKEELYFLPHPRV